MEVGLRLSVGQDALGAKEVGEQAHLREGREEDGDPFVAEEAFTEDFHEAVALVGFVCGQIEQGGLTFGLSRGGLGAEGLLLGFIRDELAGQVVIAKVNIDDSPMIPSKLGVKGIPTLMLFKDGQMASMKVGAMPKGKIVEWLAEAGIGKSAA